MIFGVYDLTEPFSLVPGNAGGYARRTGDGDATIRSSLDAIMTDFPW